MVFCDVDVSAVAVTLTSGYLPRASGAVVWRELDSVGDRVLFAVFQSRFHPQGGSTFIDLTFAHVLQRRTNTIR